MKFPIFLFFALLGVCVVATGQVALSSNSYFPSDLEFRELSKTYSEESFETPDQLSRIEDGRLISNVGFESYIRRAYSLGELGQIAIEIITLRDYRAAYALLTLSRGADIQDGPPGDAFTDTAGSIRFFQGKYWIRVHGQKVTEDLLKRIALSVSNRLGPRQQKPPSLISHFPKSGFDASSLRYFPGTAAFESYSGSAAVKSLNLASDVEIAQANYNIDNQAGAMFLLNFPTGQVAEEYFASLGNREPSEETGSKTYVKRAGPIVAILRGPIAPISADNFLASLHYSYSIRWIYEKRNNSKILWGIPVSILGTVVKSMFFIAILGVISIIAGAGFAVLRFIIRTHLSKNAPDQPERDEIIRLRLR